MAKRVREKPFTVIVEGNIGSGKTTFLKYFQKYNNISVLSEPIEMWRNCNGHNLLALMYEDPKQWCLTFQSYVLLTMLKHHSFQTPHPVKLMERSIYSARYCFIEKMQHDGILAPASASVVNEWFKWIAAKPETAVDLIVYLRTTPEVVYERMLQRNRKEEKSVSLKYLTELHKMHEDWLYNKSIFSCPAPVITLNADLDKSVIIGEYERYESHILNKQAIPIFS